MSLSDRCSLLEGGRGKRYTGQSKEHLFDLLRGVDFIVRRGGGSGEKLKVGSDMNQFPCFLPSDEDVPHVLCCFCARQK